MERLKLAPAQKVDRSLILSRNLSLNTENRFEILPVEMYKTIAFLLCVFETA